MLSSRVCMIEVLLQEIDLGPSRIPGTLFLAPVPGLQPHQAVGLNRHCRTSPWIVCGEEKKDQSVFVHCDRTVTIAWRCLVISESLRPTCELCCHTQHHTMYILICLLYLYACQDDQEGMRKTNLHPACVLQTSNLIHPYQDN